MDVLAGLNQKQTEAVTAGDKHILVVAGAGSGKTKVLVSRAAWLIDQAGVAPREIMAVTFTNKAAREMKERLNRLAGVDCRYMWIGTFHALCARLLRLEGDQFRLGKSFVIYDDGDSKALIKKCLLELNVDTSDKRFSPAAVLSVISDAKNKLIPAAEYASAAEGHYEQTMGRLFLLYQQRLTQNQALDFDDLLCETVGLLRQNRQILDKYRLRFRHILVDEYQDTNHSQYQLIKLLVGETGHLLAVGDPDQSIYRWRGADIGNILDFAADYPDCREIKLTQNYRSTQNILNVANKVIANNKNRLPKDLFSQGEAGEKVFFHYAETDRDEAHFVVGAIAELRRQGFALADCAVLYRTHGQSRLFEEECAKYNLPYRVFGGMKFYERKEIKDTLAYLRLLENPADNEALQRIYNEPRRGIGKATWDKVNQLAASRGVSAYQLLSQVQELPDHFNAAARNKLTALLALLQGLGDLSRETPSVAALLKEVWRRTGYDRMLQEEKDATERLDILEQLYDTASDFDREYQETLPFLPAEEIEFTTPLQGFLCRLALATDLDEQGMEGGYVTLMTLHAAKGLEFPAVFLVGMEEGVLPHKRAVFSLEEGDMEEERRLCYVGMTRARKRLCLSAAARRLYWGNYEYNAASRFIKEIPQELLAKSGIAGRHDNTQARAAYRPQPTGNLFAPRATPAVPKPAAKALIAVGDKVKHSKFGEGIVVSVSGSGDDCQLSVAFPNMGIKKLMWKYAPLTKLAD
ncbi:MAG: UvrD-helicase domain-containing protein [Firmicutes bacterium]|nr:UvrD-helicase domain-containing protein [Bacillota bacterium]